MNTLILIITGIAGATTTFYVSTKMKQGAVRASALLSLVVALFFYIFPDILTTYLTERIPVVFIGASFIGMVNANAVKHYGILGISGIIFTLIFLNTGNFFKGYGGLLGTSACISLLTAMSIPMVFSKKRWFNFFGLLRKILFKN